MDDDYDEREEELSSIAAIFPELVLDGDKPFSASLQLPVSPSTPLTVRFPQAPLPSPPHSDDGKQAFRPATLPLSEKHGLSHLPPLDLQLELPEGYPNNSAPVITLSTQPEWLPAKKLRHLSEEAEKLWEEFGRCQILFSYIDFLQQSAERAFDLLDTGLDLSPALQPALVEYDHRTKKEIFDLQTFDCGICLEPKKGRECHRLRRCAHVFCRDCLQESYNNYIAEGDVVHVRCLDPTCGDESGNTTISHRRRKRTERNLHPKELLDMGLDEATVRRYVEMKRKKALEADKSTVYCPRAWCQAPARSAKYPPLPADIREYPESETEDEADNAETEAEPETADAEKKPSSTSADRLCICSKCSLAFCRVCYAGWHGDFARCWPRNPSELSDEEKASYDYIRTHTSPCPTCSSPTQKTMGCNHMTCFQCRTHFCYLCGAWLDGDNPYIHFNNGASECYQKLWELEEGDEGQGNNFGGARMWEAEARRVAEEADREEAERMQNEENERAVLMDAEDDDFPLRLNGGQILPEAPAPPPNQLEPGLAAQFARLQMREQLPLANDHHHHEQQPPAGQRQARGGGGGGGRRGGWHLRGAARAQANFQRGRGGGRGGGAAAAAAARGGRGGAVPAAGQINQAAPAPAIIDDEAAAAAFRRFVELAARDEEEEWDSDELDGDNDDARWEIRPLRGERGNARR
ncbi:hypothetical protein AAFC00_005108 [Neodothiora populina]|uniref:RBR-type E3 ubiquitin transferase n=1 Tax=Neodothiora populina TaxID=2781224 RepID=A0ABR3PJU3_9PEZI